MCVVCVVLCVCVCVGVCPSLFLRNLQNRILMQRCQLCVVCVCVCQLLSLEGRTDLALVSMDWDLSVYVFFFTGTEKEWRTSGGGPSNIR